MKFGCHVSIKEGYLGAARSAKLIGASSFQYFPKNPRSLSVKQFNREDTRLCNSFCQEHQLISVSHSPYPTSLTPSNDKKEKVVQSLLNDLEITNACGSLGVVVHFGKQINGKDQLASYHLMIEMLNAVLKDWEGECKILLENNAGKPGSMGTTLEEIVQVRKLCDYPEKIGFCLDTCHAFASGLWDGSNWGNLIKKGEELLYFKDLMLIHLNNSKYESSSGKDRHANIFNDGYIKENQFEELVKTPYLKDIPFVLETPLEFGVSHVEEIEQLKKKWG
jgi:deoxyribonuclease-4